MIDIDQVPDADKTYFMQCPECNEWFDKRDLFQVFAHVHDEEMLEGIEEQTGLDTKNPAWISSKREGDPEEFLNDAAKTKIDLN